MVLTWVGFDLLEYVPNTLYIRQILKFSKRLQNMSFIFIVVKDTETFDA
jgi:hypothetical protein